METTKKSARAADKLAGTEVSGGDRGDPPAPESGDAEDPTAFILSRARAEVHLLLDNISANPEVTFASLTAQAKPKGLPRDWIEKVCEITWPPKDAQADPDELAKQAALLIKARDYLNGLAKPASGATIAFTLMVTQEAKLSRRRRRGGEGAAARPPSRTSLAEEAYPDLVERARGFRQMLTSTLWSSAAVLLFTLLISWYLAIGNTALADYAVGRTELAEAEARVATAQSTLSNQETAEQATSPAAQSVVPSSAEPGALQPAQPIAAAPPEQPAQAAAGQPALATGLSVTMQPRSGGPAATQPADSPTVAGRFMFSPCDGRESYSSAELRDACFAHAMRAKRFHAVHEGLDHWAPFIGPDTAGWWANLLGSGVLPVLYGFLGAIASVVRSLSRKIKASLLSPRDVQLTFQQLALGAVVGACISLFIGAPEGSDDTSLLGPVALSSSAVAFVAGFGVDSVFQALEALISRIFNIAPAGMSGAPREPRPGA
jgi:hypothetical protein